MQNLFTNNFTNTAAELNKNGFAVVNFLEPLQIDAINEIYKQQKKEIDASTFNGIHMTVWMKEKEIKFKIKNALEKILSPTCEKIFRHYKMMNTVFIIKNKHKISNFPLHQDWSFTDERTYKSINVWIALQDTTLHNGGLYLIKGSHRLNNLLRGSGKLSFNFELYKNELKPYITKVSLKAGQAVLFYYSTIHGSPANTTNTPRIIIATSIIPENADILINYFDEKSSTLLQYKMKDDFTYDYDDIRTESIVRKPNGQLINSIQDYKIEAISPEMVKSVSVKNDGIFDKFKSMFR